MKKLKGILARLWSDEEGATMVEYAIMVALIAVIAIATVALVGEKVDEGFQLVADKLEEGLASAR